MNRTKRYLSPVLKSYGKDFEHYIHTVFKLGFGIGDMVIINDSIKLVKHIFILIDTNIDKPSVEIFFNWIRQQPMFEEDYAYDNIDSGHLHMLIIKFPENKLHILETFKRSQYSKMFTKEELKEFIQNEETKKILIKDHNYLIEFNNKINIEFGSTVLLREHDIHEDFEFDFPININEEVFNPANLSTGVGQ